MLDKFYSRMLEKAVLPVGDRLEGGGFLNWLTQYRREQWFCARKLRRIQSARLARTLRFARENVQFYKNIPAAPANPFEDIRQFPVMTKSAIRENLEDLLTAPKERLVAESSSGSSGIQGTVYMDRSGQASQRAMQTLWFEWSGYRFGDSILQTGMTLDRGFIKGAKDLLLKTHYVPAFNLEPARIERLLRNLEKNPRRFLFGYASSLYVLAQTALDAGIKGVKFDCAVSWGDKLFAHYREKIRLAFGCETLDTYGCTEGAMIAAQCRAGNYHLSVNQCYVEIVDDDAQPVPDGQAGKVLATRLDNFAMPLVRYYLGDIAVKKLPNGEKCSCGRESPLLEKLIGRDTDIVKTRSGKQMIVHFFTAIFEHEPAIRQFKVVQKTLDEMEIHYIPNGGFGAAITEKIEAMIYRRLEEKFPIRWIETREIEPAKSGKPEIIQSFLKKPASFN
jgi:phenylacetate-CoA ligase